MAREGKRAIYCLGVNQFNGLRKQGSWVSIGWGLEKITGTLIDKSWLQSAFFHLKQRATWLRNQGVMKALSSFPQFPSENSQLGPKSKTPRGLGVAKSLGRWLSVKVVGPQKGVKSRRSGSLG